MKVLVSEIYLRFVFLFEEVCFKGKQRHGRAAQGLSRVFRLLGLGIPTSETSEKGAILLLLLQ